MPLPTIHRTVVVSHHDRCASDLVALARRRYLRSVTFLSITFGNIEKVVSDVAFVIVQQVNGDGLSLALSSTELDTLKADILKEIRSEIQKVKQEIIEG